MNKLFQELRRRNVFKAALSYAAVAWAVLQVAAIIFPIIKLDEGAMRFHLIALIICFPVWVVLA
jgi:adenylate cyclase